MVDVITTPALTAAEIAALALSLAHLGTGPQSATARRALIHLLDDREVGDGVVVDTLTTLTRPLDDATAGRARVIAAAITDRRVVRLVYGDEHANVTIREVEPVTCMVHRDHWYFVGWCRLRRGIRAFRFDRLLAVEPTGIPTGPRAATAYLPFQRRKAAA